MKTERGDSLDVIRHAVESGRLTHALLLKGRNLAALHRGALDVASRLLKVPKERVESHPDLFLLRPTNKMRQINVVNTRELIRRIQHSPHQGDRKVALISEVDRMNRESANAFLKTLEEPPSNTNIILLTIRPHAVLETILSRCLGFWFGEPESPIAEACWHRWLDSFRSWLDLLVEPIGDKSGVTLRLMRMYGLVEGFDRSLAEIHKGRWKAESEKLGEDVSDEEKDALEVGVAKSTRERMLAEMELCLRDCTVVSMNRDERVDGAAERLSRCVSDLERLRGLLELNLSESRMVEAFLLGVLRAWSNR